MIERLTWAICHPINEVIYLLGGIPKEHIDTLHYRNITAVVDNLRKEIDKTPTQ